MLRLFSKKTPFCGHLLFASWSAIFIFNNFSKTKYEEILAKAQRKQILDQDGEDDEKIGAYKQYITEVMSAVVFYNNPTMNLEKHLPNIKKAAESVVQMTKALYEVC